MKEKCRVNREGSGLDPKEVRIIQSSKKELYAVHPKRYKTFLYISSPISRTSDFYIEEKYVERMGYTPYSYTITI